MNRWIGFKVAYEYDYITMNIKAEKEINFVRHYFIEIMSTLLR